MFGGSFDGWYTGQCPNAVLREGFLGAWWGWVEHANQVYLTRLPEDYQDNPEWVSDINTPAVIHETQSVLMENITRGGVVYRCVGVSGSQIGDGAWAKSIGGTVVWYQTNWRPVNDSSALPIAGLARVRIAQDMEKVTSQANAANYEFTLLESFLIDDAEGDPFKWDSEDKLCHYFSHSSTGGVCKKTLVGPGHFVLQERRVGTKNRITFWEPGVATPTVNEWDNPEDLENTAGWPVVHYSKHAFPVGVTQQCHIETFGDGEISLLQRMYRTGVCTVNGALVSDATDISSAINPLTSLAVGSLATEVSDYKSAFVRAQFSKAAQEVGVAEITPASTRIYFADCDCHGNMSPTLSDNNDNPVYRYGVPDSWAKVLPQGATITGGNRVYGFGAIVTARATTTGATGNAGSFHSINVQFADNPSQDSLREWGTFSLTDWRDEDDIGAITQLEVGDDGPYDYSVPGGPTRILAASHNAESAGVFATISNASGISDPAGIVPRKITFSARNSPGAVSYNPDYSEPEFAEDNLVPYAYFATESPYSIGYDDFGFTSHADIADSESQFIIEGPDYSPEGDEPSCTRYNYFGAGGVGGTSNPPADLWTRRPLYAGPEGTGQVNIAGIWWDSSGEGFRDGRIDWGGSLDALFENWRANPIPPPGL